MPTVSAPADETGLESFPQEHRIIVDIPIYIVAVAILAWRSVCSPLPNSSARVFAMQSWAFPVFYAERTAKTRLLVGQGRLEEYYIQDAPQSQRTAHAAAWWPSCAKPPPLA